MSRHKRFKRHRKPEYFVLTVCRPESIDGITLKIRDLNVVYSIMLDYSLRYIETIEREHPRIEGRLDMNRPITESTRRLENLTRIMFATQLSTFDSILHYLRNAMPDAGRMWLEEQCKKDAALNAFGRLRNMDVHHEPMHTLIGMRYRILAHQSLHSDLETKETHLHQALSHEGIGFYPPPVAATRQFMEQPGLVDFVTFESILQLSHTVIHRVHGLVNEAVTLGHISNPLGPFECEACKRLSDSGASPMPSAPSS
jgi:hypothetical protein